MEEEIILKSSLELESELWKAIQDANVECDNAIYYGMIWRDKKVRLLDEDQTNLKAVYDLVVQGENMLPQVFKLQNEFFEFTTKEDLKDFYLNSVLHVRTCLAECWQKKAVIEAEYKALIAEAKEREMIQIE